LETNRIETPVGNLVVRCIGSGPPDILLWPGLFFDDRQHVPLACELAARGDTRRDRTADSDGRR
jgi:hypothetical protein